MLRVWLPLTKDLRNQGLDDVTVTNNGATFNSAGKLGGCYTFDGNDYIRISMPSGMTTIKNTSVAAWVKSTSSTLALGGISHDTGNNVVGSCTLYSSGWQFSNNGSWGYVSGGTIANTNTWHHVVCTISDDTITTYLNGVRVATDTVANKCAITTLNSSNFIEIGCDHPGGDEYLTGSVNDFRIYDHCLSPMEVKELAKGLVLHYPLNRNGWGQENLATNTSFPNSNITGYGGQKAIEYNHSDWTSGGRYFAGDSNSRLTFTEIQANQPYTISAWVYIYSDVTLSNPGGTTVFYRIYKTGDSPNYGYDIYFDLSGITERNKWIKVSKTFVSSYTYTYNQGGTFQIGGYNGHFKVSMPKVEKGSIATPWCPNSSDTLATTMGLNSTIEYDCSGFCNNGTRTGTFDWTSNTAKYAVSTKFNGTDNAIQTPSLPTMITDKNYTIAVWIYKTVIGSKGYQTIYGGPSGFEIEARNGSANETKFVPWNWGKPMASYELNEWNHCVFVHSDSDCKIYLNGEYIATGTAKASNPTGNYFIGAWNTATQQNFDGLMSDFRIYATALSADDVKSLYQNSAYIDSSGNVYGAVHSEV